MPNYAFFTLKFALRTFLRSLHGMGHMRNDLVVLTVVEEKLDVDVVTLHVEWRYIVVCYRRAPCMLAERYLSDSVRVGNFWNSNKLTKS